MRTPWLKLSQYTLAALLIGGPSVRAAESGAVPAVEIQVTILEATSLVPAQFQPSLPQMPAGMMSLCGVFTEEQLALILKDTHAAKGTESFALPALFTRSERKAKLQMTQEVRYATEYEEGTPPKPLKFESKDVGIVFEATPKVGDDRYTIDLELHLRLIRLTGYQPLGGAPINFPQTGFKETIAALPKEFPLDETVQPIFSSQELTTSATIYSGSSIVLGGVKVQRTDGVRELLVIISAKLVPEPGNP